MNETLERIAPHKVTDLREPIPEGSLTILQILKMDRKKNYFGDQPQANHSYLHLIKYIKDGRDLWRCGNTLYITEDMPDNGMEFHTLNADRAKDLGKNSVEMFNYFKSKGYKYLVVYYDFPVISELLTAMSFNIKIDKVDEGLHRMYKAKVRL